MSGHTEILLTMKNIIPESLFDDYEPWEYEFSLIEKEDWKGLLKLREQEIKKHPDDFNVLESYGEALVLNKRYQEAIDFLTPLYKIHYDEDFGITQIMDALIGLGKTEKDFEWTKIPNILRLDKKTLDLCIKSLKGKRKPLSIAELYLKLMEVSDYITFKEDDLSLLLLENSKFFTFIGDKSFSFYFKVKLKR
jgi:hypothetical protein